MKQPEKRSSSVVRYIDNYLDSMIATPSELAEIKISIDTRLAQAEAEQPQANASQAQAEHVTYRQEYVKCGKPTCTKCSEGAGHGPYWYSYRRDNGKLKKKYIGKQKPTEA